MIKIVYRVKIKKGGEKEFKTLADKTLIPLGESIKGNKIFSVFISANTREFIFYEIWENQEAIENYYKELIKVLGKNKPDEVFPKKLNDFIEEEEDILHQKI